MSKGGSEMGAVPAVKGLKGRTRKQCRSHGRGEDCIMCTRQVEIFSGTRKED